MNKTVSAALLGAIVLGVVMPAAHAASVPCEDMLAQLRAAESAANLSAADKAAVADLEAKGIERCNADDDKRADAFFAEALKLLGK
jgi:uncharacterized low-complexity protein